MSFEYLANRRLQQEVDDLRKELYKLKQDLALFQATVPCPRPTGLVIPPEVESIMKEKRKKRTRPTSLVDDSMLNRANKQENDEQV